MAARLSAATRSHSHSPRDKLGARSLPAGDGLARRLQRAVRRSRDRASGDGQLAGAVSDKSPPGAARSRQRRVIPTRSTGALMVTAPRRSQRLGPPDGRALPPATHPGLSFGARPHRGRRRQRAAVGTRPEAPRRDATCFARPGRPAQNPRQLVAALVRAQLDRTAGVRVAPMSARAPDRAPTISRPLRGVRLTSAFQPRRLMIAPAAVGCKRLLDGAIE
jgi:hypothetical protein